MCSPCRAEENVVIAERDGVCEVRDEHGKVTSVISIPKADLKCEDCAKEIAALKAALVEACDEAEAGWRAAYSGELPNGAAVTLVRLRKLAEEA